MIHRFYQRDAQKKTSPQRLLHILIEPHITEKATTLTQYGKYIFKVIDCANKIEVKRAVETLFRVDVGNVHIVCTKGKTKRFKGRLGRRSDVKKAIVTLKAGQTIDMTAGLL